jgi:cell division protein FtsZ
VFDESIGEGLRVTMVATGLNGVGGRAQQKPEIRMVQPVVLEATTNQPIFMGEDDPAVFSPNMGRRAQVDAMKKDGIEEYDIPAFLRKQAD